WHCGNRDSVFGREHQRARSSFLRRTVRTTKAQRHQGKRTFATPFVSWGFSGSSMIKQKLPAAQECPDGVLDRSAFFRSISRVDRRNHLCLLRFTRQSRKRQEVSFFNNLLCRRGLLPPARD